MAVRPCAVTLQDGHVEAADGRGNDAGEDNGREVDEDSGELHDGYVRVLLSLAVLKQMIFRDDDLISG
jgi:hypothetical protein